MKVSDLYHDITMKVFEVHCKYLEEKEQSHGWENQL